MLKTPFRLTKPAVLTAIGLTLIGGAVVAQVQPMEPIQWDKRRLDQLDRNVRRLERALTQRNAAGEPVLDLDAFRAKLNDPSRDLMGPQQRDWLKRELAASKAKGRPWQVLGNQVVMARVAGPDVSRTLTEAQVQGLMAQIPEAYRDQFEQALFLFKMGLPFNLDAWDGYPAGRERLYAAFAEAGVQPIVLAGDSHAFWVNELKDANGARRAVEFGTSAVSSPSIGDAIGGFPLGAALMQANDEVRFCDQSAKGFILLTLTEDRAEASLMQVSTIYAKPFEVTTLKHVGVSRADGAITGV